MKEERKLKLVVNKVKISNLYGVYGGTGATTDDSRDDTCTITVTDISCELTCDDTINTVVRSEHCQTGDTKTNRSLVSCINSAGC